MNKLELFNLHQETCTRCLRIMKAKNQDYTGGSDDPFANFRVSEMIGVPAPLGILIRMIDKIQRVRSFVAKGTLAVKAESVDDALEDIINYAILLKGLLREEPQTQKAGNQPEQ